MSIIWLWGLANLLVDLLEIIGIVANLPLEFLGLTFLGFGNAMPGTRFLLSCRYFDGNRPGADGSLGDGLDRVCC